MMLDWFFVVLNLAQCAGARIFLGAEVFSACLISGVGRGRGKMAVLAVDSASGT
jgi:hypothetical protein